jgi:superfamily II DNA/RNA helicase
VLVALLPQLVLEKHMSLKQLKFFVIDECDKVLEKHGELSRLV